MFSLLSRRSRGRGRKQIEENEGMEDSSKDASGSNTDALPQSDDIRTADMDISDDGEKCLEITEGERQIKKSIPFKHGMFPIFRRFCPT